MLLKTIELLKKNPVIFRLLAVFFLLSACYTAVVFPGFVNSWPSTQTARLFKILVAGIFQIFMLLYFFAGIGGMLNAAANGREVGLADFTILARKYLGKLFLLCLVAGVFYILAVFVLAALLALPFSGSYTSSTGNYGWSTFIGAIIAVFTLPFIMTSLPAVFDGREAWSAFTGGLRIGTGKYGILLGCSVLLNLSSLTGYNTAAGMVDGNISRFSQDLFIMELLKGAAGIIVLPLLFIIYKEAKSYLASGYLLQKQSPVVCPGCSAENLPNAAFCSQCGFRLEEARQAAAGISNQGKSCPQCGNINSPQARFCRSCGYRFE